MPIAVEETDTAIRNTFYNMEEGAEYVLNDRWFAETNALREEYNWLPLKDKREYRITRNGHQLRINNAFVLDFDGERSLALSHALARGIVDAVTPGLPLSLALQHNGLEKLNKDNS